MMFGRYRRCDQFWRGHLAAERAHGAGERLNPNRWVGKSPEFRDGFESAWAEMEFMAEYESGATEFLPPIYGLCRGCGWPLEDDQPEYCRKCAAVTGRTTVGLGFRRMSRLARQRLRVR